MILSNGFLLAPLYLMLLMTGPSESLSPPELGRRDAIAQVAAATAGAAVLAVKPSDAKAVGEALPSTISPIVPAENPPPILSVPIPATSAPTPSASPGTKILNIPRVGYSFYKTAPDKAERCAALALRSGTTHLDLATQYESNAEIGKTIRTYLKSGRKKLAVDEKPELLDLLDEAHRYQTTRMELEYGRKRKENARRRRENLFISHKLSNEEQSTDPDKIRHAISIAIDALGVDYLDMVSIHSPLTSSETRLATYKALINLQQGGDSLSPMIRSVGVCNYGVGPLKEIAAAGLPLPAVNQLELSPFNTHSDVVDFCGKNGIAVSCAAWSKLSGANGPSEQWDVLSSVAMNKRLTKAQVMVRWALQKGYICVPRSGSGSKLERVAIAENSYGGGLVLRNGKIPISPGGIEDAMLTPEEMKILDGLNLNYKAGKLGRTDGWSEADMAGPNWDPTEIS